MSLASSDGTATPVTDVTISRSRSFAGQPGRLERAAQRALAEVESLLDVAVVGGHDPAQGPVVGQRQDDVPGIDARVAMQPFKQGVLRRARPPSSAYRPGEVGLRVAVGREGGPHGDDPRHDVRASPPAANSTTSMAAMPSAA